MGLDPTIGLTDISMHPTTTPECFPLSILKKLCNKTIPHNNQKPTQEQFKPIIQDVKDEEDIASKYMSFIRDKWLLLKLAITPKTHKPQSETPEPEKGKEYKAWFYVNPKGKTINWSEEAIIPLSNQAISIFGTCQTCHQMIKAQLLMTEYWSTTTSSWTSSARKISINYLTINPGIMQSN